LNDVVILSHFMLDRRELGSAYSYAALQVYVALGKALGIDVDALLRGSLSRDRCARLAEAVWERSPDELRSAARKAYADEFGVELPDVVFSKAREQRRYRPER
jgi:hypothetical protein